jgi:hypothetical protein
MPFRKHSRITLENRSEENKVIYYQINYTLTDVSDNAAYFHVQFRRTNPIKYKENYTIIDGIKGKGHYVGTALLVGLNGANKWWGEGRFLPRQDDFASVAYWYQELPTNPFPKLPSRDEMEII